MYLEMLILADGSRKPPVRGREGFGHDHLVVAEQEPMDEKQQARRCAFVRH